MYTLIGAVLFLFVPCISQAQLISIDTLQNELNKRELLFQKSKSQRSTARFLAGGGLALAVIGMALSLDQLSSWDWSDAKTNYNNTGDILAGLGTGMVVGSVPLFIASKRNRRFSAHVSSISPDSLLNQGRRQKRSGLIVLGIGSTLFTTTILWANHSNLDELGLPLVVGTVGTGMIISGLVKLMAGSSKTYRAQLMLKSETLQIPPGLHINRKIAAIGLRIPIS